MRVRPVFAAIAVLGAIALSASPARAALINLDGAQLNGVLILNGGANNQFDPANGHVPPGYGNSLFADGGTGEPFALLSDSRIEFGYQGGATFLLTVDFTAAGMVTVTGNSASPFSTIGVSVVSPSFPGLTAQTVTSTPFGSCGLTGNSFGCTFTAVTTPFTTVSQLTEAVPEPASLALLGLGLAGLGARRWRQYRTR